LQTFETFKDLSLPLPLSRALDKMKFINPTPVQAATIPAALEGKDILATAQTGTGKTGAFGIPLLSWLAVDHTKQALILCPTRELAAQIFQVLRNMSAGLKLRGVLVVGGESFNRQANELDRGCDFIVATPGRLNDHLEERTVDLSAIEILVFDEVDRMLDMGFVNDMRFVMNGMPKDRHTLFFSATISGAIEGLIKEFLKEPVRISVKTGDTSKNVEQDVVRVGRESNKIDVLHDLLTQKEFSKVLIFGRTKHGVEKLSKVLADKGFKAESIHGNKNHSRRQRALGLFKENHIQILVATDVAARGLDIPDVTHVINYDIPATHDDYVHRIGRTGRGNKRGKALTFIE
jgi:superfamily II DNA/RNA helicase